MNKSFRILLAIVFASICTSAVAQSYEFQHGYIFKQKYVKRISLTKAEQIAGVPGLFEPLLSWNWGGEVIKDSRVKRSGDRLFLEFFGRARLSLRDFSSEPTNQKEGDSQKFKYIKSVPGYHIVGVEFGHDQPAFLLVSESGLNIYFVDTN